MARTSTATSTSTSTKKEVPKKEGGKKKGTAYNEYMKYALADLKLSHINLTHQERFKKAASMWKTSDKNPKKVKK